MPQTATKIGPQQGPQEAFLATSADIAIYGGSAFGGKTWALLCEGLRHADNPDFGFVIFRRTAPQIRNEGGLWDESMGLYPMVGAVPRESVLEWDFPSGASGKFSQMEHDKTRLEWQGSSVCYIGWDELTHFSATQFWYMLSRNRSGCGVRPYIRATCNPDPDSFVADLIAWWIDQDTGYAIPERSGVVRYFLRRNGNLVWGESRNELFERYPDIDPQIDIKSLTFIASSIFDNPIGMAKDPGYLGNLRAMTLVDNERLEKGNWKVRPAAGTVFQRGWFEVVDAAPAQVRKRVRAWDLAATPPTEANPDPDATAGIKMSQATDGMIYVEDVEWLQGGPAEVDRVVKNTASQDGKGVVVRMAQDPGQAGKDQAQRYVRELAGYTVHTKRVSGDKVTRASGLAAQARAGNVKIVRGPWNEAFLSELENFPDGAHDDRVDGAADGFDELVGTHKSRAGWLV